MCAQYVNVSTNNEQSSRKEIDKAIEKRFGIDGMNGAKQNFFGLNHSDQPIAIHRKWIISVSDWDANFKKSKWRLTSFELRFIFVNKNWSQFLLGLLFAKKKKQQQNLLFNRMGGTRHFIRTGSLIDSFENEIRINQVWKRPNTPQFYRRSGEGMVPINCEDNQVNFHISFIW